MGRPTINLVGKTFGRLTVVDASAPVKCTGGYRTVWVCRCECGNVVKVKANSLLNKNTKSCGCLRKDCQRENGRNRGTHRMTHSPTWNSWQAMKSRCHYQPNVGYRNYGGRGIGICKEWDESYEAFLRDMGERPLGFTLDRIDVNKDYFKKNCRWVSQQIQNNNRRNTPKIMIHGETKTLAEWSRDPRCVVSRDSLYNRYVRGWDMNEAITTPKCNRWSRMKS